MDGGDFFASRAARIFEAGTGDARRRGPGDDLQTFHDTRDHFMLDARIEVFCVLAKNDQIDGQILEAAFQAGQHLDRSKVDV